jgi:UDP-N-acetylglucosamine 1-carboxyvinyltransferase
LIIAASLAKGKTILSNCAIEPEIKDLVNFLNKMGCKITWSGKRQVKIIGVKKFKEVTYKVMFDRIEAGTYLIASALTGSKVSILKITPKVIATEINILKKMGKN